MSGVHVRKPFRRCGTSSPVVEYRPSTGTVKPVAGQVPRLLSMIHQQEPSS